MRLVVILDELDKLTATPEGEACFETLLTGIKNALVVSGVHFIVVAGADLYERFLNDSQRGNSVYESVFAWSVYLPCMWESANALLNHVVSDKGQNSRILADYLDYQARGIPRRLYQNLNQLVCWEDGGRAKIKLNDEDWERIEFYALLQNILFDFSSSGSEEPIFPNALDQDRWRLGTYHLVDWLLETRGRPFTLEDIDDSQKSGDIDVLLHLSRKQTEALLDHLLGHRLLEEIRSQTDTIRLMEDAPEAQARIFKVNMNIRHEISMEREGMGPAPQPECIPITFEVMPAPAAAAPPETYPSAEPGSSESQWRRSPSISEEPEYLDDGRYELRALVGHGGMGSVWEAWDRNLNTEVAVKISHRHANSDSNAVARFRREMGLVMQLRHPNIVRFYDTVHDGDRLGIVMDLVRGEKLSDLIESGVVSIELTMSIFLKLAEALVYLEDKGVYRLDLKPHNVILNENGEPILIDFGIAKWDMEEDFNTMEGVLIGTPHYMSPEQARGELLDIRSDLFSLGLVLVSMLHGGHPISGDSPMDIVRRLAFGQVALPELNVSSGLKGVIDKMTAADVDDRYRSANEMLEAFFESPEGLEFQAKRIKKRA